MPPTEREQETPPRATPAGGAARPGFGDRPIARPDRLTLAVAALAVLSGVLLAARGDAVVADKPLIEDAFYALAVSRQIGLGNGFTIDGVTPVNGVQPLWTVLCAPFYAFTGGDRVATLRWVFVLAGALAAAGAIGAAAMTRLLLAGRHEPPAGEGVRSRAPAVAAAIWAGSALTWRQGFNGLETGLALAVEVWLCVILASVPRAWRFRDLLVGALLGIAILARIDVVLLTGLVAASEFLAGGPLSARFRRSAVIGCAAAAVSLPWWVWNVTQFGAFMPTSGAATAGSHLGDAGSWRIMADAWASNTLPFLWAWSAGEPYAWILRTVLACLVTAALIRIVRGAGVPPGVRRVVLLWLAFCAALVLWYISRSRMNFFYLRYLAPAAVVGVPAAAILLTHGLPTAVARLSPGLVVAAGCALGLIAFPLAAARLGAGNIMLRDQVTLVRELVPPGEAVAARQTGTLGYFVDGVVNLDGKVNADVLAPGGVAAALSKVRWLCDDATQLGVLAGAPPWDAASGGRWIEVARRRTFVLLRRRDD